MNKLLMLFICFCFLPLPSFAAEPTLIRVRLLILKHSWISMADGDADLAIKAVNAASQKGLKIENVGNYYVDENGQKRILVAVYNNMEQLKRFVSEQMKVNAESGDTFIVFTIGHGFGDGTVDKLGARSEIMKALAQAAEDNNQETLWWQLSCHASAGLPTISSLTPVQQELFSTIASSTAAEQSPAYVEGKIMEKVFIALAEKSPAIDPNGDDIITKKELADFLMNHGRGKLLFAASEDEQIFGGISLAHRIPIFDRKYPGYQWPKTYLPLPGRSGSYAPTLQ